MRLRSFMEDLRGFCLPRTVPESIRNLAAAIIVCLFCTATGCAQTTGSKPHGKTPTYTDNRISEPLICPAAGSRPAASIKGHHSVILTWKASRGNNVVGYCLFRSARPGVATSKPNTSFRCAGCEQINSIPVVPTGCVDNRVPDDSTYFYVATAFDGKQLLSSASNEVRAKVPGSPAPPSQTSPYDLCQGSPAPESK